MIPERLYQLRKKVDDCITMFDLFETPAGALLQVGSMAPENARGDPEVGGSTRYDTCPLRNVQSRHGIGILIRERVVHSAICLI